MPTSQIRVLLVNGDGDDALGVPMLVAEARENGVMLECVTGNREGIHAIGARLHDAYVIAFPSSEPSGIELIREVVRLGCRAPLVLLTGSDDEEQDLAALRAGAADCLARGNSVGVRLARVIRRSLARAERKRGELDTDRVRAASSLGSQIEKFIEHERAESTLRDTEEQLRLLLDSTGEGIYGVDLNGQCTFCNPAAARLFGYDSANDLLGRDMHATTHHTRADGRPYPKSECRIFEAYRRGEPLRLDDELLWRADGTSFPADYFSHPIRKRGEVVGAVVTFVDITERVRARQALEKTEARFRNLAEASFDAISVIENGVIQEANRGFVEMFGYALHEVIGRPALDFVSNESREIARRRLGDGIEGHYELVGKRKDGSKIRLEATARMHRVGSGWERVTALRDVTEKRALEEQLRQSQKMEAIGRLAGGVAHDFNNLLTVIISYTALLLEGLSPSDPRGPDLEEIKKAAQTAAGLTRQLLAFSRRQVVEPRLVRLDEVVANAEKLLRRLLREDIVLSTSLSAGAYVKIDPGQLEQLIMNLVVNARDAMPKGGWLMIETASVQLDEAYAEGHWPATPGAFAMLAVSDDGVGMDEATRERIFEPFFTTKEAGNGTGLGLATVYGIVKQNGGFIWVYSEPGLGTTFKIYLPLADAPKSDEDVRVALPDVPRGTETVLLVEDEPSVRRVAREILRQFGYTVLEAPTGHVAFDIAATHRDPIHLLLTDVVMPEMSGRQVAEQLVALRPDVRVLYMSGYTAEAVLRHGVLEHGMPYLQKPFGPDSLARKVREVLDVQRETLRKS